MKEVPYDLLANYFANECSKEEKALVENWRDSSTKNKTAFDDFASVWKESSDENDFQPDTESALDKVSSKIDIKESSSLSRKVLTSYYRIAAIIIISICVGLGYIFVKSHSTIKLVTLENEKQEITLADGSKVWLNSSSSLSYPRKFNAKTRSVFLKGEGFFEISKNPDKPFIVESENSVTRVTGTAFNVKTSEEVVVVTVEEGSVLVSTKVEDAKSIDLVANEKAVVNIQEKSISKQTNKDLNFTAWKTGKLHFKNTSLPDAVIALEEFYNKKIEIEKDSGIDTLTLTSNFDNNSLEEVINIIKLGLEIEIIEQNEKLIFQKIN